MATGKSSNLGASSSTSKKTVKQQEKRKQRTTRAEQAKKPRPFQLIDFSGPRRRSATAAVPLQSAASSYMATAAAFPSPMAGVNGAAPLWSTAATLGAAASRAAASTLSSMPAMAGANGPSGAAPFVIAPAAPVMQPPAGETAACNAAAASAAVALALPAAIAATGVRPPMVLAQAGGELVPLPLHFVGYYPTCRSSSGLLPAPTVGIPLAAALDKIENGALGRMMSALMPACRPPLRQHQSKTGPPPPWWPTGSEDWWAPELLAHLDTAAALVRAPSATTTPVPFASSYSLKKAQKVAVLVAIVKHLAPDFGRVATAVRHSGKLSASEADLWHSGLNNERAKYTRPVFVLLPQQEPQTQGGGGGGGASTDPSAAAGSVVVHSGSAAASNGVCELQVANLPAAGASVPVPAPAGGSRGEVIAAAELAEKEQRSDSVGDGVVSATDDAPAAGDGRDQRPVNFFPAGGGGSTHKQGAVVAAAAPTGHVRQVEGEPPEMTTMQPPEQHSGVPGSDVAAAAAEDDQVQVHPVVDVEGHPWWHNHDELNRMFAEFESFGDLWY